MQVYLEYAVADNLVIDYFLLLSSLYLTGNKLNKFRIFLSALLGTLVAIILPLFTVNAVVSFFVKILLALVMIFTAGEYKNLKGYVLALNLFKSSFVVFCIFIWVIVSSFLSPIAAIYVLDTFLLYAFLDTSLFNEGLLYDENHSVNHSPNVRFGLIFFSSLSTFAFSISKSFLSCARFILYKQTFTPLIIALASYLPSLRCDRPRPSSRFFKSLPMITTLLAVFFCVV